MKIDAWNWRRNDIIAFISLLFSILNNCFAFLSFSFSFKEKMSDKHGKPLSPRRNLTIDRPKLYEEMLLKEISGTCMVYTNGSNEGNEQCGCGMKCGWWMNNAGGEWILWVRNEQCGWWMNNVVVEWAMWVVNEQCGWGMNNVGGEWTMWVRNEQCGWGMNNVGGKCPMWVGNEQCWWWMNNVAGCCVHVFL